MKKTILTLFIGFISLISFGQNAQTAIYDNLDEDNPSFSIAPGNTGSLFTRVSETSTQVDYTFNFTLNQPYRLEHVNFAYNSFGDWVSSGLAIVHAKLTNIETDSIYPNPTDTWSGLSSSGNLIQRKSNRFYDTLEPGNYQIVISLRPESVWEIGPSGIRNKNFTSPRQGGSLKPDRYATAITYEDGSYPIEILGTQLCPELDVQLCSASQNFALGYDESATITINNVENAEGELSYLWSNEETTAGIVVAPTVTTTYSVTVTDENGCTGTAEHEVAVYDVAYTKEKKDKETDAKKLAKEAEKAAKDLEKGHNEVIMTHKGDHEHKVKAKDVAKKLNDKKGEWTLGTLAMTEIDFSGGDCADEDRYKTDLSDNGVLAFEEEFTLNAYPNPVRNILTLESETKLNGTVKLYDLYGALLDERIAHDVWELNLDFTHLRKGFYTVVYENNEGLTTAKRILKD